MSNPPRELPSDDDDDNEDEEAERETYSPRDDQLEQQPRKSSASKVSPRGKAASGGIPIRARQLPSSPPPQPQPSPVRNLIDL